LFGSALTLHVLSLVGRRWDTGIISFRFRAFFLSLDLTLVYDQATFLGMSKCASCAQP
jgi:hypothetical protein